MSMRLSNFIIASLIICCLPPDSNADGIHSDKISWLEHKIVSGYPSKGRVMPKYFHPTAVRAISANVGKISYRTTFGPNHPLLCASINSRPMEVDDDDYLCTSNSTGFNGEKDLSVFRIVNPNRTMLIVNGSIRNFKEDVCDSETINVHKYAWEKGSNSSDAEEGKILILENIPKQETEMMVGYFNGMMQCSKSQIQKQKIYSGAPTNPGLSVPFLRWFPWFNFTKVSDLEFKRIIYSLY